MNIKIRIRLRTALNAHGYRPACSPVCTTDRIIAIINSVGRTRTRHHSITSHYTANNLRVCGQPHHSRHDSPRHPLLNWSLSSAITPSLFHSRLKTYLTNTYHRRFLLSIYRTASR